MGKELLKFYCVHVLRILIVYYMPSSGQLCKMSVLHFHTWFTYFLVILLEPVIRLEAVVAVPCLVSGQDLSKIKSVEDAALQLFIYDPSNQKTGEEQREQLVRAINAAHNEIELRARNSSEELQLHSHLDDVLMRLKTTKMVTYKTSDINLDFVSRYTKKIPTDKVYNCTLVEKSSENLSDSYVDFRQEKQMSIHVPLQGRNVTSKTSVPVTNITQTETTSLRRNSFYTTTARPQSSVLTTKINTGTKRQNTTNFTTKRRTKSMTRLVSLKQIITTHIPPAINKTMERIRAERVDERRIDVKLPSNISYLALPLYTDQPSLPRTISTLKQQEIYTVKETLPISQQFSTISKPEIKTIRESNPQTHMPSKIAEPPIQKEKAAKVEKQPLVVPMHSKNVTRRIEDISKFGQLTLDHRAQILSGGIQKESMCIKTLRDVQYLLGVYEVEKKGNTYYILNNITSSNQAFVPTLIKQVKLVHQIIEVFSMDEMSEIENHVYLDKYVNFISDNLGLLARRELQRNLQPYPHTENRYKRYMCSVFSTTPEMYRLRLNQRMITTKIVTYMPIHSSTVITQPVTYYPAQPSTSTVVAPTLVHRYATPPPSQQPPPSEDIYMTESKTTTPSRSKIVTRPREVLETQKETTFKTTSFTKVPLQRSTRKMTTLSTSQPTKKRSKTPVINNKKKNYYTQQISKQAPPYQVWIWKQVGFCIRTEDDIKGLMDIKFHLFTGTMEVDGASSTNSKPFIAALIRKARKAHTTIKTWSYNYQEEVENHNYLDNYLYLLIRRMPSLERKIFRKQYKRYQVPARLPETEKYKCNPSGDRGEARLPYRYGPQNTRLKVHEETALDIEALGTGCGTDGKECEDNDKTPRAPGTDEVRTVGNKNKGIDIVVHAPPGFQEHHNVIIERKNP